MALFDGARFGPDHFDVGDYRCAKATAWRLDRIARVNGAAQPTTKEISKCNPGPFSWYP